MMLSGDARLSIVVLGLRRLGGWHENPMRQADLRTSMNRIVTVLALTGAVGLLSILPASQAGAHHAPGATYYGHHDQGGRLHFTLSGEGQGCVGARAKVKKLKTLIKRADSAEQKKNPSKKLKKAKYARRVLCNIVRIPKGTTPTGTMLNSLSIGGPVIGQGCTILRETETFVPETFVATFPPGPRGLDSRHEIFDSTGWAPLPPGASVGTHLFSASGPGNPGFVEGFGRFSGPRAASGLFQLARTFEVFPGGPLNTCRSVLFRWDATLLAPF